MSSTSDWLESEDMADVAFVLAIDGLGLAYTTHRDITGLSAAWDDHDILVRGGLKIQGAIQRSIELFDAKIKPSSLTFRILDVELDLFPLMFGRGRTDILRTRMAETATADATTIQVADVTQIPGLETVYVGLETMITTAEDTDEDTWTVERGQYSIFPRAGGTHWARTHTVPQESGAAAPAVTDAPTVWINRPVGLYVCHRVDGVWTAGLPGSSASDAELLWAGRIKHYGDPGDGWLRLECAELTEMLMTSLATKVFEGTINEGSFFTEAQSWISITVAIIDPSVTIYRYTAELGTSGTRVTHQQLANAINAAFSDAFVVNAGTYAPSGTGANINLTTDPQTGEFRYQINFIMTGPADGDLVAVVVFLSPKAWSMLGFTARFTDFTEVGTPAIPGVSMAEVKIKRRVDVPTLYIAVAAAAPRKLILDTVVNASAVTASLASIIVTATTDVPFQTQTRIPASSPPDTNGFLRIADRVFAVAQLDLDTFVILRELDELVRFVEGDSLSATNRAILEFLEVPDTNGDPVKVRQAWIEPDSLGPAMLRLLCSTGTPGYNIPLYDDLPPSLGVGFPSSLIDIAAFLQMSDAPYLIVLTEPTPFAKLLESALNVIGKHCVWSGSGGLAGGGGGKLTIISPFESATAANLIALTEANKARPITADDAGKPVSDPVLLGRTDVDENPESIINRCTLQYHPGLKSEWLRKITVNAVASQSDYDQVRAAVVDGYGIFDGATDIAAAALLWESDVVGAALAYFSQPVAVARRSYNFNLATRLGPGSKVVVADDGMHDPTTGERGVDGLLGWAVETEFDWMTGIGQIGYCYQPASATVTGATKLGVLAPSARVDETFHFASAFDSETAAMYRFNETSVVSGYATAVDASGNGRDLDEDLIGSGSSENYTHIINGPGGKVAGKYARWFPGVVNGAHLTRAADADGNDCFDGSGWSVEAWVRPILGVAGMKVFTYQLGVSADPLYMAMADVTIDAIGRVGVYWETSTTSSGRSPILEYSADALPDDEWSHIAVTVDRSGATATVKFYLDGQLNRTVSGVTKSASGTGGYNVGHQPGSAGAFHGAISDLRVSTVVRSAASISASATDPDYEHDADDATLALWRFDEAPDAIEESEYGYHARLLSGTVQIVSPLAPDGGQARDMAGPSYYIAHAGYAPLQEALAGDWSFDCWTDFHTGYSAAINALWRYGGTGETAATNATILTLETSRKLKTFWEHGAGVNDSETTAAAIFASAGDGENVHHLAVVFWSSGGVYHIEVYLDGVLLESLTPTSRPDGMTAAWLLFGYDETNGCNAVLDDLRWSSVRRTASEIADIYAGGWASGYNSLSKTLQLKPHEYSPEDEDVDMAWFVATDKVHIVDLSPADPDAPDEWDDTVASVDAANNRITLTTGLAGWPDRGHFVVEFQGKAADTSSQKSRAAFIADDTTRSTGVADNDANVWGGDPLSADAALEQDIVYRRWNRAADDVGEPLSVHKLHELRDWANTALVYHTAPVFLSEIYATPVSFAGDGTSEILLGPPIWIPLYAGGARSVEVRFLASMGTDVDGGATLRAVTSTSLPTDDGAFLEPTWDVSYALATVDVAESDDYAWYTATVTVPVQVSGLVPGCWLAVSVLLDEASAGVIRLRALHVAEVTP